MLGKDAVFTPLRKEFLEKAMNGELEAHFEEQEVPDPKTGMEENRLKHRWEIFRLKFRVTEME